MEVTRREVDDAVIVDVNGDVDVRTSPAVRKELLALTDEKRARILVGLSGVPYIDSSGIATLVECMQRVRQFGGVFRIFGVNPRIRDVFTMAKLDRIFSICESEKEAMTP